MTWHGSGFDENGYAKPGTTGRSHHLGDPLTAEQIRELPDGAEVVISWCGGNGPHPYRVLVDYEGQRRTEGLYCDLLLEYDAPWEGKLQKVPLHRVTPGWDDFTREWAEGFPPEPEHIQEHMERLRKGPAGKRLPPEQGPQPKPSRVPASSEARFTCSLSL